MPSVCAGSGVVGGCTVGVLAESGVKRGCCSVSSDPFAVTHAGVTALDSSGNHNHAAILSLPWAPLDDRGAPIMLDGSGVSPVPMTSAELSATVVSADSVSLSMFTPGKARGIFRHFALDTGLLLEEVVIAKKDFGLGVAATSVTSSGACSLWGVGFPGEAHRRCCTSGPACGCVVPDTCGGGG